MVTCQEARLTGDVDLHRRSLVASTGAVASLHDITFSHFRQNCLLYWVITTVIWKFTAAIWSYVLKRLLLGLVTLFFEIKIEPSQRGPHVWVRRRRLSCLLPFLKSLGRIFLDYCIIPVGRRRLGRSSILEIEAYLDSFDAS